MKQLVLDLLGCPECWGDFRLSVFVEQKSEIIEGFLDCSRCGRRFPVIGGVPRVIPNHLNGAGIRPLPPILREARRKL